jgi:hypothetical protein
MPAGRKGGQKNVKKAETLICTEHIPIGITTIDVIHKCSKGLNEDLALKDLKSQS